MPKFIEKDGDKEIWKALCPWSGEDEYLVYGHYDSGDPRSYPSLSMAREVASS